MKHFRATAIAAGIGIAVVLAGPRVSTETSTASPELPGIEQLGRYLEKSEARFDDITPGAEKTIVWSGLPGEQTPWSVVYVHGFSGTRQELTPVPDSVARHLGANLYYTRMTGHGRPGEALAEATLEDWTRDVAEAIRIGQVIGRRVILMGTSNGGAVVLWAAAQDMAADALAAVAVISPNFGPADPRSRMLLWPWGEYLARAIVGPERSWEPVNERHARFSTTRYPTRALLPMMATVRVLEQADLARIHAPTLIVYSRFDEIVSVEAIRSAESRFSPGTVTVMDLGRTGDPSGHVLAGDMLSPETTPDLVAAIVGFLTEHDVR